MNEPLKATTTRRQRCIRWCRLALLAVAATWLAASALGDPSWPRASGERRTATACAPPCAALAQRVAGEVVCNVAAYKFNWGNKICDGILPRCVLRPVGAADVAAAVALAQAESIPLSYRSGGHSYTCNSIKADSLHIDLRSLNAVQLHPATNGNGTEMTFGAGQIMRGLLDALPDGQMIVHGQCPTVGAGGLFLHGGYHTTLTLKYGRGNDTVTHMEVVTANGTVLQLSDGSPHAELWAAMRQAGSSFAIATRITVRVIEGLPPATPTDGGDFFALDGLSREAMLGMVERAAHGSGLLNYIHINGVDFLVVAASTDWHQNVAWLQRRLGRKLSAREWLRNSFVDAVKGPVSSRAGGDARFGSSGAVPYVFSTQEAFATVSFIMPLACYVQPHMRALLAALPARRDPRTDLGCYFQVTTTYVAGKVFLDYNCPYESAFYRRQQRDLNAEITRLCPGGIQRYVNTPSAFLTPRDYFDNYDALAAIKSRWDPHEVFRVYQGVRPTGRAPDTYEFQTNYVRQRSWTDWLWELAWDAVVWSILT